MSDGGGRPTAEALLAYLDDSPSPYHAVAMAARRLVSVGFREIEETADWTTGLPDRWFVRRGGALVAAVWPEGLAPGTALRIVGAHTDSPNLRLKPRPTTVASGWQRLAVEVYGGPLLNSWLDRDLGLAGRVSVDGRTGPTVELVDLGRARRPDPAAGHPPRPRGQPDRAHARRPATPPPPVGP